MSEEQLEFNLNDPCRTENKIAEHNQHLDNLEKNGLNPKLKKIFSGWIPGLIEDGSPADIDAAEQARKKAIREDRKASNIARRGDRD